MTSAPITHGLNHAKGSPYTPKTSVRRVHVLDLGVLEIDRSVMSYGLNLASVDHPGRPAEWIGVPMYAVLIETDNARILFDTGAHPDSASRWSESLQPYEHLVASSEQFLPARLEQLGVRPEDIDIAVLSHLHMDHSGGVEFLTNADVFVHRSEFRHALDHYARSDGSAAYVKEDVAAWIAGGVRWSPIEEGEEGWSIVPGVELLNFGAGHTEGDLGLQVQLPRSGALVLASDACYSAVNLGPPVVLPGSSALIDSRGMLATARRLQRLQQAGAEVWFGHDPEQYSELFKAPDGCYE